MTQVFTHLYLGSAVEASDYGWLKRHNITHIVNCTGEHPNYYPKNFYYLKLNLDDDPRQNITRALYSTRDFIRNAIASGGNVLVHCHAGISRAASVVIDFIMYITGWDYNTAYGYVKRKRDFINPNSGFVRQLKAY